MNMYNESVVKNLVKDDLLAHAMPSSSLGNSHSLMARLYNTDARKAVPTKDIRSFFYIKSFGLPKNRKAKSMFVHRAKDSGDEVAYKAFL